MCYTFISSLCVISVLFTRYIEAEECKDVNKILFGGDFEFIDLTHPFDKNSVYWPNAQAFSFTKKVAEAKENGSWYAANDFCAGEHGGTHLDAPYHFVRGGAYVGDIPLNKLILPLIIADISSQVNDDPNYVLYKHNLDYMLNNNFGNVNQPCVVVFKFGWSKFYRDKKRYLGMNEANNTLNFPGLSQEVAHWIVSSYPNVVGVGVDVASVDPGSSADFPAHKTMHAAGLYHMENVNLSQAIPESGCTALVMPMKIAQGTGAPLRLVAICPGQASMQKFSNI